MSLRFVAVVGLAGCSDGIGGVVDTDLVHGDRDPPAFVHEHVQSAVYENDVPISATITDASGVESALLFYQQQVDVDWTQATLVNVGEDAYEGTIPGADVGSAKMRYYLSATDGRDQTGCYPDECDADPLEFPVTPD